jgi:hypothetical protein
MTTMGNKAINVSFFGQCTSRKFGMKLSSCQVLLEIRDSRPIGPMCYFLVLSLKLHSINGPNMGFRCHVCLTLWIILLYDPSCFECQLPTSSTTSRTLLLASWFGWKLISHVHKFFSIKFLFIFVAFSMSSFLLVFIEKGDLNEVKEFSLQI